MNHRLIIALVALSVVACGEPQQAETAEEFAARVQGQQTTAEPSGVIAQDPAANEAEPAINETGNSIDPQAASCGAPAAAKYLGQGLNDVISRGIHDVIPEGTRVRVLKPGSTMVANPGSDRLNVIIDNDGIITDFRCG